MKLFAGAREAQQDQVSFGVADECAGTLADVLRPFWKPSSNDARPR